MDLKEDLVEQFVITITCRKHIPNLIEKLAGAAYILDGAKAVTTARVMTTIPALTDSESADCYILSGTDPVIASRVRLNNSTPKPYTRETALKRAALLDGTFESVRDVASAAHNEFAEANGGREKNMRPHCQRCHGTGVVEDGMIHGSGGVPYENGPVRCIKDCPDCADRSDTPGDQS